MLTNRVKRALQNDQPVFGVGLSNPVDVAVLRILAAVGVDWLFIDMEHGAIEISALQPIVTVADVLGLCSVARIPSLEYHWVARSLDTGTLGLMVPRVETQEQAEHAVEWSKFPPMGSRGMGSPAYLSYAKVENTAQGIEISNRESMVVLQVESVKAVENLEGIAGVPGVDVLFIGPMDMSISVGTPGQVGSEANLAQFRKVIDVARRHRLATGIVCRPNEVKFYYEMGIRMFSITSPFNAMRAGLEATAAEYKQQLQHILS